ncbi:MAG: hypothetical protein D6818_00470 [Bacteroidetes bacterium]|nr:MAG: hypothetical protein D6818_00470 [Bacteroidota bacterium]
MDNGRWTMDDGRWKFTRSRIAMPQTVSDGKSEQAPSIEGVTSSREKISLRRRIKLHLRRHASAQRHQPASRVSACRTDDRLLRRRPQGPPEDTGQGQGRSGPGGR